MDVIIPIAALVLTVVLLYKFNWTAQFTITNPQTKAVTTNVFAIVAMLVGYVVLPAGLMFWKSTKK